MMGRTIILSLAAVLAVSSAPPVDPSGERTTHADRRLRACLSASAGDGHTALETAILAARAACKSQIDTVRDARILAATAGLESAAVPVVERRVTRQLDAEIARAVATFAGLPPPNTQGPDAQDR